MGEHLERKWYFDDFQITGLRVRNNKEIFGEEN